MANRSDKAENFTKRLAETWGSELEPELVTPMTAGPEELTPYEEVFPLTRQFKQTNMHSDGLEDRDRPGESQLGRDVD